METRVLDRLGGHASAWDRLVDQMPLPSPFLRSWWLANVAVGDPRYVLVFEGERLLGGLALQRSMRAGVEWLEFLGAGPLEPDHLDLVASPADVGAVSAGIRDWLGRPGDRVIDLVGARRAGWVTDAVPGRGSVTALEVAPYVVLPPTAAEYLATRPGKMRSTITRTAKRLAKAGLVVRDGDLDGVEESLEALRSLHDGRWGEQSGFLASWDSFAAAARAGVAAGELVFHEMVDPMGAVVAVEVDFAVANRTSFYQAGRLTDHELRGSGSVLRYEIIGRAIASGSVEFDLLRGGERYKTDWAGAQRGLVRIRRGVGPRGMALVAVARANVAVQGWRSRRAGAADTAASDADDASTTRPAAAEGARIVFYTDAAQIGGAESVAKNLLRELDPRFGVIIMGTTQSVVDDIAAVRPGVSTMVLPEIVDRSDVAAMAAHRQALRALKPDIFHANLSDGSSCQYALLAALSIPGLRIVVTENSPMGVRSELSRRIKRFSASRFDAHIGVGDRAAALVAADIGVPTSSMSVIANGVPVIEHRAPQRAHAGPSIVAVSRFDPVKGLDVLIRSAALLDDSAAGRGPVQVDIYGDGPQRPELEALIAELDLGERVRLVGWADDVRQRLGDYDVFVLPSRLEGMPMSLIEAMHAGVAAISTDVGSVREVLTDDVSGRIVAPDDPAALAAAIGDVLGDDTRRAALAAEGHRSALERFTSARNVAEYEAVYDRLLAAPASRRLRPR